MIESCGNSIMEKKYLFAIIFTTAIWGTTFPFAKILLEKLSPVGYTAIIMILASSFLLGLSAKQHKLKDLITIFRARWILVLFLGLFILPAALLIQYTATRFTTSTNLAIIAGIQPAFVMIINLLLFKAVIDRRAWIGTLVAFVGVYFVMAGPGDIIFGSVTLMGDLLGLVIAATWAVYTASGKKVVANEDPLAATSLVFVFSLVTIGILWGLEGTGAQLLSLDNIEWLMVVYMGVCCQGVGFALWYWACRVVPTEKVSLFSFVSPLTAVVLGVFWLLEPFTWVSAMGFGLTIVGLYIAAKEKKTSIHPLLTPQVGSR